ncbi:MAG: hypothetical protein Q7T71_03295 [Herbiconiux sp.]|nr:hypothetical protein [Herbiconiux sp.]
MHEPDLTPGARATLDQLEHHPTTHDLGWHDLVVMLKEITEVEESHGGRTVVVHLAGRRLEFTRPEGEPVSEQAVLELRRAFKDVGYLCSPRPPRLETS